MEIVAIMGLVLKGITVIEALVAASKDAAPAITAIKNIVSKPADKVTQADMDATHLILDEMLVEFNKPLPDEKSRDGES